MLFPKSHKNHMLPIRCIQEPCRNMEVIRWESWRPGSARQTKPSPMRKPGSPGRNSPVSSPGDQPVVADGAGHGHRLPAALEENPDQHVDRDDAHGDVGRALGLVFVAVGNHDRLPTG